MSSKAKWTILIYIAAHNDLNEGDEATGQFGNRSWKKILSLGSTHEVNTVILLDTHDGAGLYSVDLQPGKAIDLKLGAFDSGDPAKLIEVTQRAYGLYPADHYGLVLWSHGNGWTPDQIGRYADEELGSRNLVPELGAKRSRPMQARRALFSTTFRKIVKVPPNERAICFDDGSHHSLDTLALAGITTCIKRTINQQLDLLGMDACLMASAEVAYQLRKDVSYLVASEELVPATSWPYDEILKKLYVAPEMPPRKLATLIVDEYLAFYAFPPPFGGGDVTKIALDLSKMDPFAARVKHLAEALLADMPQARFCLQDAQNATEEVETAENRREDSKFIYHLWDIYSVADHLAQTCSIATVKTAAKELCDTFKSCGLVVQEDHLGEWFSGIGGLSVYLIPPKKGKPRHISRFYHKVAFATDTRWEEMLKAYRL